MRTADRIFRIAAGVLSVGVGLAALRYALPDAPAVPIEIAANRMAGWLPFHALTASLALLVGPFQFLGRGGGARHRLLGRVYAVACLVSAPAGLMLALGSTAGPVATLGFGLLAVLWFATTAMGWRRAMQGRIAEHRRWMIRSYALAFGAVTLRLYLPFALAPGIDYFAAYRAISFLAWVPNLVVVEAILDRFAHAGDWGRSVIGAAPESRASTWGR